MRRQSRTSQQSMCYVVAYDIPDDKRRTKIHKLLLAYGKWTQYSLFECFLTRKDLVLLRSRLAEHLVARKDSVRFYPLCANCVSKVETVGGPPPADQLSGRLKEVLFEHSPPHVSRSSVRRKRSPNAGLFVLLLSSFTRAFRK